MIKKALTIDQIKHVVAQVAPNFGVSRISLFGSYADGTQHKDSDIDMLVEFNQTPVCLLKIIEFKQELQRRTSKKVDVLRAPLSPRSFIKISKAVQIYG